MFPYRISWLRAIGLLATRICLGIVLEKLIMTGLEPSLLQFCFLWIGVFIGSAFLMSLYHYIVALSPYLKKVLSIQTTKMTFLKEGIDAIKVSFSMEVILAVVFTKINSQNLALIISFCLWVILAPLMYQAFSKQTHTGTRKKTAKSPKTR